MGKASSSSQLRLLSDEQTREKADGTEEEEDQDGDGDGDGDGDEDRHVVISLSANGGEEDEDGASSFPARARHRTYPAVWFAMFLLGAINNLSYVVVLSAAKSLAQSFHQENLIGVIQWANVGFGTVVKALNTWWLLQTRYDTRVIGNTAMGTLGLIMLALSGYVNFPFAIVGIVLIGCFSSLGESVILGYLRDYDATLIGAWTSGAGAAGVGGTVFYLLMFSVAGVGNRSEFIFTPHGYDWN